MNMPFGQEAFIALFQTYNEAFPYLPIATYAAGVAALFLAVKGGKAAGRGISAILALLWLWNGGVYHLLFFRTINPAATIFGALFLLQGVLFMAAAITGRGPRFEARLSGRTLVGALFLLYALLIYPLLGHFFGHSYPASPVFGMAPCPTTIFTFGMLLLTRGKVSGYLLVIPLLWAVIGLGAALGLGIYEDLGLTISGLVGTTILAVQNPRTAKSDSTTSA